MYNVLQSSNTRGFWDTFFVCVCLFFLDTTGCPYWDVQCNTRTKAQNSISKVNSFDIGITDEKELDRWKWEITSRRRSIDRNVLRDLYTVPLMAGDRKFLVRPAAMQLRFLSKMCLCVKISFTVLSFFVYVSFFRDPHSTMNFLL